MKKIVLVFILLLNLLPIYKNGNISINYLNSVSAQGTIYGQGGTITGTATSISAGYGMSDPSAYNYYYCGTCNGDYYAFNLSGKFEGLSTIQDLKPYDSQHPPNEDFGSEDDGGDDGGIEYIEDESGPSPCSDQPITKYTYVNFKDNQGLVHFDKLKYLQDCKGNKSPLSLENEETTHFYLTYSNDPNNKTYFDGSELDICSGSSNTYTLNWDNRTVNIIANYWEFDGQRTGCNNTNSCTINMNSIVQGGAAVGIHTLKIYYQDLVNNSNEIVILNVNVKVQDCDCNGVHGGTAYLDDCYFCVDGNTGNTPCWFDCNGDYLGSASFDYCGVCSGGYTNNIPNTTCGSAPGPGTNPSQNSTCQPCIPPTTVNISFSNFDYCKVQCDLDLRTVKKVTDIFSPHPEAIDQSQTPLCGMVCLAYYWAKNKPVEYRRMVTNSMVYGSTTTPNTGVQLYSTFPLTTSDPNSTSYPATPIMYSTNKVPMPQADFIFLTVLKNTYINSKNKNAFYCPGNSSSGVGGTDSKELKYEMINWLGLYNVVDNTFFSNIFNIDKAQDILQGLDNDFNNGKYIILSINAYLLDKKSNIKKDWGIADHWVTYAGNYFYDPASDIVSFDVISWGAIKKIKVSSSDFKMCYDGYLIGQ